MNNKGGKERLERRKRLGREVLENAKIVIDIGSSAVDLLRAIRAICDSGNELSRLYKE